MATQGLVTLVSRNIVIAKAITGINGMMAEDLELLIKQRKINDAKALYDAAIEVDFGLDRLVVQHDNGEFTELELEIDPETASLYKSKYNDPTFNPRWDHGTADYVRVIDVDTWETVYSVGSWDESNG